MINKKLAAEQQGASSSASGGAVRPLPLLPVKVARSRHLKVARAKNVTLLKYQAAVDEFREYARINAKPLSTTAEVDRAMALFVTDLFEDSRNITDANYCLYGWLKLVSDEDAPDKYLLGRTRENLKGWSSRFPGRCRHGVIIDIFYLYAQYFEEKLGRLDAAICCLLCQRRCCVLMEDLAAALPCGTT